MNQKKEDDRLNAAFSLSGDASPLEYMNVVAVEKALRQVRAFACLVIGNRVEADEIVEDALILYLSTDPEPEDAAEACAFIVRAVRRLMRTNGARARRGVDLDQALSPLLDLTLETREIAGLHLGAGLPVDTTAALLDLTVPEVEIGLDTVRTAIGPETYDRAVSPA